MYNPDDYTRGMGEQTLTLEGAVSQVLRNVYGWMAVGLAITAVVAMAVASMPAFWMFAAEHQFVFWVPMIAEIGIVIYASARLQSMSFTTMAVLMAVYSALNGLTMSVIFLAYTMQSIAATFFTCAATFGAMCFVGHTTKTNMNSWGKYFLMALIGLIIATVVNYFLQSPGLELFISYAGVLLFVGLTAYDAQKIKEMVAQNYQYGSMDMRKLALWGSLSLYLDCINLFLHLLRIMGERK